MNRPRKRRPPITGRDAAVQAIAAALEGSAFASRELEQIRAQNGLDPREAGLAIEISRGVVRQQILLDHLLSQVANYAPERVKPIVRAILLAGAYQVVWLDSVPAFAAVDSAVEQAKKRARSASGMVNAVLRRLVRAIAERRTAWQEDDRRQIRVTWDQACAFNVDLFPAGDTPETLLHNRALATGERIEMFTRLVERLGLEQATAIGYARRGRPATALRRNMLLLSAEEFAEAVRQEFGGEAIVEGPVAYLPASINPVRASLFRAGHAYAQDTTAYEAARMVNARPGERILDLCSAPGGKAVTMALQMQDRGHVLACDVDPARLQRIRENVDRLKLESIQVLRIPDVDPTNRPLAGTLRGGPFDAVLVDVPCSNTGVIARRPEARQGLCDEKLASLTKLQATLLDRAAACIRAGGRMVYSTCSLEPEENERQVAAFLDRNPDWQQITDATHWPAWGPSPADWRDGGYAALLKRRAESQ